MARMEMKVGCLPKLRLTQSKYNTLQYLVREDQIRAPGWAFLSLFLCILERPGRRGSNCVCPGRRSEGCKSDRSSARLDA